MNIHSKARFAALRDATIHVVNADGEQVATFTLPVGLHRARPYLDLLPPGCEIELGLGVELLDTRRSALRQDYGRAAYHTAANPDYRPTLAGRMEREMRVTLARMQAATNRVEAREKALLKVREMPSPEVIEATPAPAKKNEGGEGVGTKVE